MKLKSAAVLSSLSLVAAVSAVDLETANLKVSFYESATGKGRISHLIDKKTGLDFVSQTAQRGLWQIECRRTDDYTVKKVVHADLGFKDMEYTCTKIERGLQFTYRNVGDCLAEVVCRGVSPRHGL